MVFDSRQRDKEPSGSTTLQSKTISQIIDNRSITATRQHQQSLMSSSAAQQSLAARVASSQVQRKKNNHPSSSSNSSLEPIAESQQLTTEEKAIDISVSSTSSGNTSFGNTFFGSGSPAEKGNIQTILKKSVTSSAGAPIQMTKWKFTNGFWRMIQTTTHDKNGFPDPNTLGVANEGDEYDQDTGQYTSAAINTSGNLNYSDGQDNEFGGYDGEYEEYDDEYDAYDEYDFGYPTSGGLSSFDPGAQGEDFNPDQEAYALNSTEDEIMNEEGIERFGLDLPDDKEEKKPDQKHKTKKRKLSDANFNSDSEFSESEDDAETSLTSEQKLKIIIKKGRHKKRKLLDSAIKRSEEGLSLNDPRHRKVFGAHRSNATSDSKLISDINQQEYFQIGSQTIRLGSGTGHFIQPGGNEDRPTSIKEPSPDYHEFFDELRQLGKDKNAGKLYKLITGKELPVKDNLTDVEIAVMLLYYMNNDAGTITDFLGARSQLTEHLSKFTAISCLSEFMRGFEAEEDGNEAPYDTTLLIKQGLYCVASGTCTLQDVFFKGQGGKESKFLGAPSGTKTADKIGGATYLRDPLNPVYKPHLDRQMGIFPDNKGEFKKTLNSHRSNSNAPLPQLSDEAFQQMEQRHKAEQVQNANNLLTKATALKVPTDVNNINDFLNGSTKNSLLRKYRDEAKKLRKLYKDNKDALAVLDQVDSQLRQKTKKAQDILFR